MALDIGGYLRLALLEQDGARTLQVMTVQVGVSDVRLPQGHPVQVAVGESVLELTNNAVSEPVANATSATAFTQWLLKLDLDDEAIRTLADAPITAVQVEVLGNKHQLMVKKKKGKKLQAVATCLASSL